jgi:hypothetical protein
VLLGALPAQARDRALVIGVNQYPGLIFGGKTGGKDLSGAVPDAKTFAALLVDVFRFEPGDIRMLVDAQATKENILSGIADWLTAGSGPGDRVVLYFSGHGATAVVEEAGKMRLTSTIVPADASGDLDARVAKVDGMIEGRTLGQLLARLEGRHVTVVADSCNSGSVTRGLLEGPDRTGPRARTITEHVPVNMTREAIQPEMEIEAKTANRFLVPARGVGGADVAVWSAATIAQETFDLPDGSGGIFTQSFAEGLRDRKASHAGDGVVTAGGLFQYVRARAQSFCNDVGARCTSAGLTPELQAQPAYLGAVLNPPDSRGAALPTGAARAATEVVNLFQHLNDFSLNAEILPGTHLKRGDKVRFRITSAAAGTLMVLDTGPDGKLRQIFPNGRSEQLNKGGHVNADAPITIPDPSYGFSFQATDIGPGVLLALVADQALDLSGIVGRSLDPKADASTIIAEIADKLDAPKISRDLAIPNGSYHWAFVTVPYAIAP